MSADESNYDNTEESFAGKIIILNKFIPFARIKIKFHPLPYLTFFSGQAFPEILSHNL